MGAKRSFALSAVLASVALTAAAGPAQATVYEKGDSTFSDSFPEEVCGIATRHDITVTGHFRSRAGKGDLDQAFFGHQSIHVTDTFTSLANGAWYTIEARLTVMDVKARPLGGNVFEFKFRESGAVVLRDMHGTIVWRDRGSIWSVQVFDTLGDSQPGGTTLDERVVRVNGPHPGFDQSEDEFCDTVHDLIG